MTAAIRQQRKRDRVKAGLVRIEAWVPEDKADAVRAAIERSMGYHIPAPDEMRAALDAAIVTRGED